MQSLIFSILIPVCSYILTLMLITEHLVSPDSDPKAAKQKKEKKAHDPGMTRATRRATAVFFIELCVFVILSIVSQRLMYSDGYRIPGAALTVSGILPFAAVIAPYCTKNKRLAALIKHTAVCAFVLLIAEVIVFNGKSLTTKNTNMIYISESLTFDGDISENGTSLVVSGNGTITLDNIPENTNALMLDVHQEENYEAYHESRPYYCEVLIKDEAWADSYMTVQSKYLMSIDKNADFSFYPYGDVISLQLRFSDIADPVTISGIRAVSAIPFKFSNLRYFVLLSFLVLIFAAKDLELYKITFDQRKRSHTIAVWIMVVLCTSSALVLFKPGEKMFKYERDIKHLESPYAMTFDAFMHKQVSLDYDAEPALEELKNPYDPGERYDSGVFYLFDYSYHDGKYYCYFGATPVLTLFFPAYLLTGKIPTVPMVNAFFGTLAIFMFCMALLAMTRVIAPRANLLLLLGAMPAGTACIGVLYALNFADMYCVPLVSGLTFLFLCLWLGFAAISAKKSINRMLLLVFSSVSLVLCVGSRPGMALCSAVLVPFFLRILSDKKQKLSYRLKQACCFVVPLMIGAFIIMWYNAARFGSPFDFGAKYQLTVSDIHANKVRFADIPAVLYHYFFMPPRVRSTFPFFDMQEAVLGNYGKHTYVFHRLSAFANPMILLGVLLVPMVMKHRGNTLAFGASRHSRNAFYIICIFTALFIAWQDFGLGGVIQRYVIDIMPLMTVCSIFVLLRLNAFPSRRKYFYTISSASMLMTFAINWLVTLTNRTGNIHLRNPELLETLEDLVIFWQ